MKATHGEKGALKGNRYAKDGDGNEQYSDMEAFIEFLARVEDELPRMYDSMLYIEQPLERSVALDPAQGMLAASRRLAAERGLPLDQVRAVAERLPFLDGVFDAVMSRTAPHHYIDIQGAVREMARVVRPGGRVAVTALQGHTDPALAALVHQLELLLPVFQEDNIKLMIVVAVLRILMLVEY